MIEEKNYSYGAKLAILYSLVWFIDLLDASSLNVALSAIAASFAVLPTDAEWTIVGFLLSMTIGISLSSWLGEKYGTRAIFLLSQCLYIVSSIGSGFSTTLSLLVCFRIIQGFAAGMAIPLGMTALLKAMPQSSWAKTSASMNMITLIAPAVGPLFGAYITNLWGWQWIFLLKLPLSLVCLTLSIVWVKKEAMKKTMRFDWAGFFLGALSLSGILWVFSEIGKNPFPISVSVGTATFLLFLAFLRIERKSTAPLVPLKIFQIPQFTYGNLIQSAANTIFLGANFLIALYLQKGLGLDLISTGWIMAAITPGMLSVQPLVGKFYNRLGPLPFIIPGLILLTSATFAFTLTTAQTSHLLLALLVFGIGAASSIVQTANVTSIFSSLPSEFKGAGSSLYSLFKQISASFGVALSTMILSFGMSISQGESHESSLIAYHSCFLILAAIPGLALFFCKHIDNQKALDLVLNPSQRPTEA